MNQHSNNSSSSGSGNNNNNYSAAVSLPVNQETASNPQRTASLPPPGSNPAPADNNHRQETETEKLLHKKGRSKNWTRQETLQLIRHRTELEPRFARSGRKTDLWDEISESLRRENFYRDAQQCRDKWEKLTAGYKEVRDGLRDREDNPFFDELDPLLSVKSAKQKDKEGQTPASKDPSEKENGQLGQIGVNYSLTALSCNRNLSETAVGGNRNLLKKENDKSREIGATGATNDVCGTRNPSSEKEKEKLRQTGATGANYSMTDDARGNKYPPLEKEKDKLRQIGSTGTNCSMTDDASGNRNPPPEKDKDKLRQTGASVANHSVTDDAHGNRNPSEKMRQIGTIGANYSMADDACGNRNPSSEKDKDKLRQIGSIGANCSVTDGARGNRNPSDKDNLKLRQIGTIEANYSMTDDVRSNRNPSSEKDNDKLRQIGAIGANYSVTDDDEVTAEERPGSPPARKRRKVAAAANYVRAAELEVVRELVESLASRQQRFFAELLESLERKEQIREQIRLEKEEKWRAEERAQRGVFHNAMIVLTKKLMDGGGGGLETMGFEPGSGLKHHQLGGFAATATTEGGGGGVTVCTGPKKRSKNWKRAEVLQLIKFRADMEMRFAKSTRRAALWDELAELLVAEGIKRDGKQCREKWDKLMAEYKDVSDGKRDRRESPYFAELTAIVGHSAEAG